MIISTLYFFVPTTISIINKCNSKKLKVEGSGRDYVILLSGGWTLYDEPSICSHFTYCVISRGVSKCSRLIMGGGGGGGGGGGCLPVDNLIKIFD